MDAIHRLTESAATKWSWFLYCWRLRDDVRQLLRAFKSAQAAPDPDAGAKQRMEIEISELKDRIKELESEFETAKEGNRALLRFVHTRHRLGTPPEFGSIRASLMKSEQTK